VILLDRDGIINQLVPYPPDGRGESPLHVDQVRLIEGAAEGLQRLRGAGYLLACATNQPAAAKGLATIEEIEAVQAEVEASLAAHGVAFDTTRVCLHHPDARVLALKGPCDCRKPAPGMLLAILTELGADAGASWMVGDTDADILAGQRAGLGTVLVQNPASRHKRFGHVRADATVVNLTDAIPMLLAPAPAL
jgi:D-glycero-D-manno-heptose 1,7-bisphosphate phosphatase